MIVIDAGALVLLVADAGPVGEALRDRVAGERLAAPYLVDVEVASALLGRHRGGKLSDAQLDAAWDDFGLLPIRRMEHMPVLPRVRELYANLSAYDATYVALAEGLQVPLVTSDGRIVRSGRPRCKVEVFNEAQGI
ncbi:type II toxin-antitoxin system VapC family toxin [Streptomyces sp. ISL-86]|uniref:type II toxin-antitoxin system VapC family toxin n=1 Tax=Streptomyces sp. ISL-86 TaxID=2819187 RepID=UPI001BE56C75|nr:type II toxin-antitoxin system VapC family toxin [Streptomyces sp. ISL-86]MBT2456641.1 type II toxin-antitoxin system VapC family toxin [Streptomyces sp. ISL-86]